MSEAMAKKRARKQARKLDAATQARRAVLAKMAKMTPKELLGIAIRAGIYTEDGRLTPPYRDDAPPSACRPTD